MTFLMLIGAICFCGFMMACMDNMLYFKLSKKREWFFNALLVLLAIIVVFIRNTFDIHNAIALLLFGVIVLIIFSVMHKSISKGLAYMLYIVALVIGIETMGTLILRLMGIDVVPIWSATPGQVISVEAIFQDFLGIDSPLILGHIDYNGAIYLAVGLSFAALFAVFNRFLKKRLDLNIFNSKIMKLLAVGAGVMLVFIYMNFAIDDTAFTLGQATIDFNEITYFLFFIMSVVMFVVISRYASKENATRTEKLMIEASNKYIRDLEESYNTLRAIRHDYVNILSSFKLYIDDEDMTGLSKYYYDELSEMNKDLLHQDRLMGSLENIRLNEVKSILIYKCSQAAQHEIGISFEIREPIELLGISTAIVCQMLGILLDNAVEAASKVEKKELNIAIVKNPNSTAFIIKNTWEKQNLPISKLFELGFSTKQDGSGVGLYTVRKYTEKIKGLYLETETTDEHFTQILTVSGSDRKDG